MADPAASVPLWFTAGTFALTLLSSQALEYWKDKRAKNRDSETRREARRIAQLDKRNQFQRETLLEMQQTAIALMNNLLIIINQLMIYEDGKDPFAAISNANDECKRAIWRWGMLNSHVRDLDTRKASVTFGVAISKILSFENRNDRAGMLNGVMEAYNDLNERIGTDLRSIDDVEMASED